MEHKDMKKTTFRINGWDQIKRFFEIVDENPDITNSEISLYFYLLNVNNSLRWKEWIVIVKGDVIDGSRLSEKTFYKALGHLEKLHLIERRKGVKDKAGHIKIVELKAVNFTVNEKSKAVNFTVNDAVNDAVNVPPIGRSLAVESTVNVPLFNNSITYNKVTSNKGETFNEKKSPPFVKNTFSENENTEQDLRDALSENWINETCIRNNYDSEKFSQHAEAWINRKIKTGDYKYQIEKLQSYCIDDFEKLPSGKKKNISISKDDVEEFAKILSEQEKQKKDIPAADTPPPPPPQKVLDPQKVLTWEAWANGRSKDRNFNKELFLQHAMDWIRKRNNTGKSYNPDPEMLRKCLLDYTTAPQAPDKILIQAKEADKPKPDEPPVISIDPMEEILRMSKRQTATR